MITFTVYDQATGRIRYCGESSAETVSSKSTAGEAIHTGEKLGGETHYFDGASPAVRPVLDLSALTSAATGVPVTLTGLPEGATVTATPENGDTEADTVTSDGLMDVTFASAGTYVVSVSEVFPTRPASIEVEVS